MATSKQELGAYGEEQVVKKCDCPRCKRPRTLRRLPTNFKCADVICNFCGYLGQVKATTVRNVDAVPGKVLGAAWGPQKARMDAGIYFPLFLVAAGEDRRRSAIYYLSADLQILGMFVPRKPLSTTAKRSGWQGFTYDLRLVQDRIVRVA